MTFSDFDIAPQCVEILDGQGIHTPSPIQEQAIPPVLDGNDLIAIAQTGTGKTLAFALPGVTLLAREKAPRNAMLILVPTRELCIQVEKVLDDIGKPLGITSTAIYGGVSLERQADELKQGRHVLVATPGRLLDHISRGNIRFKQLKILVLDEADRMLDMGFFPDISRIVDRLPKTRQTLMFSATFPAQIERLANSMMTDPKRVEVGMIAKPVDTVRQILYAVRPEDKTRLLLRVLEEEDTVCTLIFLRTKDRTEQLAITLKNRGYSIIQIHGDRSQVQRQQALDGFRSGKYKILVATDVAARGLDIDGVSHVVNFDIPLTADDYIHRIGRTARAEAEGDAVTFVTPLEFSPLEIIERALGHNLPRAEWENAPPVLSMYQPPGSKPKRGRRRGRSLLRRR
ncbi:MAG: DEAD/DEAH box helicase [Candidatus Hydrogenedentes bacterium]|nr:DEAD/DEAH box helicase [Candidatus Hydrogenedentota bacterium]